jgi:predicted helicase
LELIKNPEAKKGETAQLFSMNEINTERAKRELETNLFVIMGNPPYNASQDSENQNNKNKKTPFIDKIVKESYAKTSKAQLKNKLYDPYVKFFAWANQRLDSQNGIICFVSNNSFMSDIQFDGMRKHLLQDFQRIYHIDLGGDVYSNPKLSGTKHNVFGIKVGVGITFLIRNTKYAESQIFYYQFEKQDFTREEKYAFLEKMTLACEDTSKGREFPQPLFVSSQTSQLFPQEMEFLRGQVDSQNQYNFGTENIEIAAKYQDFIPLYAEDGTGIFIEKYPAVSTNRTEWVYDFEKEKLVEKITKMTNFFNEEVDRLAEFYKSTEYHAENFNIDHFVRYEEKEIKWSRDLKKEVIRSASAKEGAITKNKPFFDAAKIQISLFRPFIRKFLYYDRTFIDSPSKFGELLSEGNEIICLNGTGQQKAFSCLITNLFPEIQTIYNCQTFPLYRYEKGEKKTNINVERALARWDLAEYANELKPVLQAESLFYYVYGILHHEGYRKTYENLLKTSVPRVPVLADHFEEISEIGRKLADLHLNFDTVAEYPLDIRKTLQGLEDLTRFNQELYSIRKMRIKENTLIYNHFIEIDLPPRVHEYKVNGRSPIQWLVDQCEDYETDNEEVISLIKRLVSLSLQSIELLERLGRIAV